MSTPPRLTELECPGCHHLMWVIDSDCDDPFHSTPRDARPYPCPTCKYARPGWKTRRQAPPAFLLQPHDLYPMPQDAFNHWVEILRTHFPAHPVLKGLGTTFVPRLPEEAAAIRSAHARAHPVGVLLDQDGARRIDPSEHDVSEWLDMMEAGDTVALRHRDGGALNCAREGNTYFAECLDATGARQALARGLDAAGIREICRYYLAGDVASCIRKLRASARRSDNR